MRLIPGIPVIERPVRSAELAEAVGQIHTLFILRRAKRLF